MQLSSRILTALAVLILAVAVVAVRAGSTGTVDAATGTINVLNVGTCYTTDSDIFDAGDCKDGKDDEDINDDGVDDDVYNVAGRKTISEVDSVYATYAVDPKTSGDQARAILKYSDLIKISIEDKGRDKRTGKIYIVSDSDTTDASDRAERTPNDVVGGATDACLSEDDSNVVRKAIGEDRWEDLVATCDDDTNTPDTTYQGIKISSTTAHFRRIQNTGARVITTSGDAQFRLTGGTDATRHPMAPLDDGKVYWFGTAGASGATLDFESLNEITLDEDLSTGREGSVAPWMRVTAALPTNVQATVQFIYYETSEREELVGGHPNNDEDNPYPTGAGDRDVTPVFAEDETSLVVRVSSDGNIPSQNLWLKEKGRFSGFYEGYVRLTDPDGNGAKPDADGNQPNSSGVDPDDEMDRQNWGLPVGDASGAGMDQYAVIGTESGPVTITYKNSKGDNRSISITVDKDAPSIQVDSPVDKTASTDDSPELIGTFTDTGGSGLREDSFKVYADNRPEPSDTMPVWDLGVLDVDDDAAGYRGHVCIDAAGGGDPEDLDESNGICDDTENAGNVSKSAASLRAQYFGYTFDMPTYGIIGSDEVYLATGDGSTGAAEDGEDDLKDADAEEFEDGDTMGEFDTIVRIDFPPAEEFGERYNDIIDIQAVVVDIAGNIGFSDADPSSPTFIHDFGTAYKDRDKDLVHNVLGVFSRHTYYLDDVDPMYETDMSATGFFVDADGDESRTSSGLMIVFDGPIDPATVGIGTFTVELDGGTDATVIDAAVDDEKVYLLLEEELAPDATPSVDLASGQSIADLAGNESTPRRLDGIELSDGILPTFTVTLSGGTGLNDDIDGEGPSELTRSQMKISVSANEAIQGAPQFVVVCDNLYWGNDPDGTGTAKFASNRTGAFTSGEIGDAAPNAGTHNTAPNPGDDDIRTMCPDHTKDAVAEGAPSTYFDVAATNAHRRAGNNWEYDWSALTGDQAVEDGTLTVIVWGRDRSAYMRGTDRVLNYSASHVNFEYDTELEAAWDTEDGLVPDEGEDVFEVRPFVLLDFEDEDTTVNVTLFEVDGEDHTADLQILEGNEFVWWPEPLAYGTYTVYVEANDAANNKDDHEYNFTVKERAPFVLDLLAGWNSISFPANPVDRALHAVFTESDIDQVIGWDATETVSPWRMATRVDGVWTTSDDVATLNDVEARYGYWVHSQGFITQAVALAGKGDRATDGQPNPADIPTDEGWNFVGVVDVDGDQTQDDAGETLRNSNNDPITAAEYLGNYTRAYTWDHINNTWDVLKKDEGIVIGTGIWVYYTSGHDIAP